MNGIDYVIILLVACLIFFALRHIRRTAKKGGCGGCGGCGGSCGSCGDSHDGDEAAGSLEKRKG